jgi:hypothetical protein
MNKPILAEAGLVDLTDDELKEFLGYSWEAAKSLEEAKNKDQHVIRVRDELRQYLDDNYNDAIKDHKARLKAARAQAKVRGIKWKEPEVS